MRVEYEDLMEKLGTGKILSPYETRPWFLYDEEQGITCSAEVRIGPGADDVEVEIQFLNDEPDARYDDDIEYGEPEQIFVMRFLPTKERIWSETMMLVKGEDYNNKIYNWGERGCEFFVAFISALQMNELPDVDELIEEHLTDKAVGRGGRRRGRVGKKGLKMTQSPPPMGMKQ